MKTRVRLNMKRSRRSHWFIMFLCFTTRPLNVQADLEWSISREYEYYRSMAQNMTDSEAYNTFQPLRHDHNTGHEIDRLVNAVTQGIRRFVVVTIGARVTGVDEVVVIYEYSQENSSNWHMLRIDNNAHSTTPDPGILSNRKARKLEKLLSSVKDLSGGIDKRGAEETGGCTIYVTYHNDGDSYRIASFVSGRDGSGPEEEIFITIKSILKLIEPRKGVVSRIIDFF